MPLYEYECRNCAHHFEWLVRGNDVPECPACKSAALERRLSVFAAHTSSGAPSVSAPGGCGHCGDPRGPGACSID